MKVRSATAEDVPVLIEMGRLFHQAAAYREVIPFDPPTLEELFRSVIGGRGVVFIVEREGVAVGMAGLIVVSAWHNRNARYAQELFWWVNENERGTAGALLFRALMRWAEEQRLGLLMGRTPNLDGPRLDGFYRAQGFVPWDVTYFKAYGGGDARKQTA